MDSRTVVDGQVGCKWGIVPLVRNCHSFLWPPRSQDALHFIDNRYQQIMSKDKASWWGGSKNVQESGWPKDGHLSYFWPISFYFQNRSTNSVVTDKGIKMTGLPEAFDSDPDWLNLALEIAKASQATGSILKSERPWTCDPQIRNSESRLKKLRIQCQGRSSYNNPKEF